MRAHTSLAVLGVIAAALVCGFALSTVSFSNQKAQSSSLVKKKAWSEGIDTRSLKAVRAHLANLRAEGKMRGVKGEEAGVDYWEAFEYFLEERINPGEDEIDVEAYNQAVIHRENMPPAQIGEVGIDDLSGKWAWIGPKNMDVPYRTYYGVRPIAGRVGAMAYDPNNASIIYVGGANGGVFKSTDSGATWKNLSESWDYLTVSSIAIDPTNSQVIYVGTGDHHGGVPYGMGIMKSTDGGTTWTQYGNAEFGGNAVSAILIEPTSTQIITASVGRGSWGGGDVWRSTNGGTTWSATNAPNVDCKGLTMGTLNGGVRRYYAATSSGLYYSDNMGATWTSPAGQPFGSIAAVSASKRTTGDGPLTLYVLDTSAKKIWRTKTGTSSWEDISAGFPTGTSNYNWSQSTYDFWIGTSTGTVSGVTKDVVYVGLITVAASKDGGDTWTDIASTYGGSALAHNDQHCFANHPTNPNIVLTGSDGGAFRVTYNPSTGTATFAGISAKLALAMFYAIALHPSDTTRILGGTQDNASPNANGDLENWNCRWAGDGGFCLINQSNPLKQVSTSQNLNVYQTSNEWSSFSDITPTVTGESVAFIAPIAYSNDQNTIYALTNRFRVRGASWDTAGTGQLICTSGNGRCIGISPNNSARVYTGASNGDVWMTSNAPTATTWTQINTGSPSLPVRSIKDISVSPTGSTDVLVAVSGTGTGHLWRCASTTAGTRVWTDVSGSGASALPNVPCNAIARDPIDPANIWYAGTDIGVFMTKDAGSTWLNATKPLGLPNVRVNDLEINATTGHLYAGTFGRGIYRIQIAPLGVLNLAMPYAAVVGGFQFTSYLYITGFAPPGGAVVTLTSSNPAALSVPSTVTIGAGLTVNTFTAVSHPVTATANVTVTATYNGTQRTDSLLVQPPSVVSVRVLPTYCAGGTGVTGTVQLNGFAPTGGKTVQLIDNNAFSSVPASVTVPAGSKTVNFNVTTSVVSATQFVTITATTGSVNKACVLTVYQTLLSTLAISPKIVVGGNNTTGTVSLTNAPPSGGANVLLSSNRAQATVPSMVNVPAGQLQKSFTITCSPVVSNTIATITATRGPVTKTDTVTITP